MYTVFLLLPSLEDEELEEFEAKVFEKLDSDGDLTEVGDSFLDAVKNKMQNII